MIDAKIQDAFNEQINAELFSSYLYLSMSAYFESVNLSGMANWMRVQVQEENAHAMKFYNYIHERGGKVELAAIEGPQIEWSSPLDAFEAAYKHECHISSRINDLVDLSINQKDHASNAFLQWFVTEQVEEEASAMEIVDKLKLMGEHKGALFMLDKELGQRVFVDPNTSEE
jgi:ferritin